MNKRRKRFIRLVTVLCAAIFLLGSQMTVFAATTIVGGSGSKSSSTSSSTSTTTTGSSTSSAAQSAASKAGSSSGSTAGTTTSATTGQTSSSRVTTGVQTGVMERIYPFAIIIGAAVAVFAFFFHLQMNQVRYGKSEKYYKELLDFICACKP